MRNAAIVVTLCLLLIGCDAERVADVLETASGRTELVRAAVAPPAGKVAVRVGEGEKTLQLDLGGGAVVELVRVPPGEFQMGSPEGESERQACDGPVHRVRITRPFYMGRCEVTNAQYRRFRPDHHSGHLDGDEQPALWVSWHDADAFCRWLSAKTGRCVCLPTEAEWEYACRAGTNTRFHSGDRINGHKTSPDLVKAGWYGANSGGRSRPVGQLAANAFGLHDMHGNAWEWCEDWFAADYYRNSPEADPPGPAEGTARVLRGGCWFYWTHYYCRSSHRYRYRPDARECVTGFRIVVKAGPARPRPPAGADQPWPPSRVIAVADIAATAQEREVAKTFGPPAVFVPKPSAAPKIDGQLDDACWAQARPLPFVYLSGRAAPPTQATTARVLADGESLYFAFDCAESDMQRLTAAGSKRDDPVWQGDTVEVFLDPQHAQKPGGYYHVAVNPAGVTMDTKAGDAGWNPALRVATGRHAAGWRVELALPLKELGVRAGEVPTVWGMNLTRYRPEIAAGRPKLGQLNPHSWPVDEPEKLRFFEDSGWAPTLCDSSHVAWRFGHAILDVGTSKTAPPGRLFELIAREDFSSGGRGRFSAGTVVDGGAMGVGKALRVAPGEVAVFQVPLTNFADVHLLAALKVVGGSQIYWHTFGKTHGTNKCCPRQVTTLTRDATPLAPSFNHCDGAGRIDVTSSGVAEEYYAGFRKHLSWFSEPTIGRIHFAGPEHWAVVFTRLGDLQTQHPHNKRVDPATDSIPGWYFHSAGKQEFLISEAVMFRGVDNVPPEKVRGVKLEVRSGRAVLSWPPARDNTLTVWYKVLAGEGDRAEVVAEAAALSAELPLAKVRGRKLSVCAVDFFENVSEPSRPVAVK